MSEAGSVLIIYADDTHRVDVGAIGRSLGAVNPPVVDGILEAKAVLEASDSVPTYIVIDIGARNRKVLEELDMLAQVCEPKTRVVVTGSVNEIGFYRQMIERGVVEYFPYPSDAGQIVQALQKQAPPTATAAPAASGFAIGFMSAASGDGASTVALNTAYVLANHFKKSVVLVDLDYQFGMVARNLDLKAPYGIKELLDHPDRGVDSALLKKMTVPYGDNLHVIAAPPELNMLPNVRPEQVVELLAVLKSQYDFVILDIQHVWVPWIASLVKRVDHSVVVSQLWLRSLTHVTRLMACWKEAGIHQKNISFIINRSGSRFKEVMSVDDFERVSGLKINFSLPNDIRTLVNAESQGKAVVEAGESELTSSFRRIAGYLHQIHTGEEYHEAEGGKKKGLFGMFN